MPQFAAPISARPLKKKAAPAAARPQPRRPSAAQRAVIGLVLQRRAAESAAAEPAPKAPNRSGLPKWLKAGVERLSGLAMDDVRVHRDSAEPAKLGALAYTKGSDIHLGPGQEQHLPHEAWHVVQQKQGRVTATTQMKGAAVNDDPALERAADRMGSQAMATHPAEFELPDTARPNQDAAVVQRKPARAKKPKPGKAVPIQRPGQVTWSLLAPDPPGWRTVSDDEIYAPLIEAEAREQQELEAKRTQKLNALRNQMKGWSPDDQEFALELLARVFKYSTNIDPRAVSDANRQPILSRYEQWLRAVDEQRLKACADNQPGVAARSRAAFRGDKPCVSWFSNKWSLGRSYVSSKIEDMDRQLRINRGALSGAVDQVYWDVLIYRKETDPKMLQMQADAAGMIGGLGALGRSPTRGTLKAAPVPTPGPAPFPRISWLRARTREVLVKLQLGVAEAGLTPGIAAGGAGPKSAIILVGKSAPSVGKVGKPAARVTPELRNTAETPAVPAATVRTETMPSRLPPLGTARIRNIYSDFEPVRPSLKANAEAQVAELSRQVGERIPANRVLVAPWVGSASSATSEGWLRSPHRFWAEFQRQFGDDFKLIGPGRTVTRALAEKWGWSERTIGQKLEHHHIKNGALVVALPANLHSLESDSIHAKVKIEGKP